MRGQNLYEGVKFSPTKRLKSEIPVVPGYLYDYSMAVEMMHAQEYDFRNIREIKPVFVINPVGQTNFVNRKKSYQNVGIDGRWGHVPETNASTISRKQEIERLRRDVKKQC